MFLLDKLLVGVKDDFSIRMLMSCSVVVYNDGGMGLMTVMIRKSLRMGMLVVLMTLMVLTMALMLMALLMMLMSVLIMALLLMISVMLKLMLVLMPALQEATTRWRELPS